MRKKKTLKLDKDTLLVLESGALADVAGGGISIPKPGGSAGCTATGCTCECPTMQSCPPPTSNCTLGCPTYPQPLP